MNSSDIINLPISDPAQKRCRSRASSTASAIYKNRCGGIFHDIRNAIKLIDGKIKAAANVPLCIFLACSYVKQDRLGNLLVLLNTEIYFDRLVSGYRIENFHKSLQKLKDLIL